MPALSSYIGPERDYTDLLSGETIHLTPNQQYEIDIKQEGPTVIVNGQPVMHPDTTIWIILKDGAIQIPYSMEALPRQWTGLGA